MPFLDQRGIQIPTMLSLQEFPSENNAPPRISEPSVSEGKAVPAHDDRITRLIELAEEQGYVTRDDVARGFGTNPTPSEEFAEALRILRTLEIEITDSVAPNSVKAGEPEDAKPSRLETLDDPVRLYLKSLNQYPRLGYEQEMDICKEIEQ